MKSRVCLSLAVSVCLLQIAVGLAAESKEAKFKDSFGEDKADLGPTGKNPFFILEPGYTLYLKGGKTDLTVTALDETKMVDGVKTRIVEERETSGGKADEVSRNYFAISKRTNNVYYFGEETRNYKADGTFTIGKDSWEAGKKGQKYGLLMPASPKVGDRYYQEVAPEVAMDRAEVVSLTETVRVPAGTFENCLKTEESSAIEGGKEYKTYAPGIGLLEDGSLKLVKHGQNIAKPEAGAKAEKPAKAEKGAKAGKGKTKAAAQEKKASVSASELPAGIRKAIDEAFPKGEIVEVQKEVSGDNPGQYDVVIRSDGKELEVEISPEGKVIETKPKGK
jgi:hypothetical protein